MLLSCQESKKHSPNLPTSRKNVYVVLRFTSGLLLSIHLFICALKVRLIHCDEDGGEGCGADGDDGGDEGGGEDNDEVE